LVAPVAEVEKPIQKEVQKPPEIQPVNVADLESKMSTLAIAAVAAYGDAVNTIRGL
jgi:hypothetical protein